LNLTIVGIAGPGDALANWPVVKDTIQKIKTADQEAQFCLSTNGLLLPELAEELKATGVHFLTVTINALEPRVGRDIYRSVYWQGETLGREAGFELLRQKQQMGIVMAVKLGMVCKVNTVVMSGINDHCIPDIAEKAKSLGCDLFNLISLLPVKGSAFEHLPLLEEVQIQSIRKQCSVFIRQMYHCQRCRADAIGTLHQDASANC
jgi:nitrogen fixation protein NifB